MPLCFDIVTLIIMMCYGANRTGGDVTTELNGLGLVDIPVASISKTTTTLNLQHNNFTHIPADAFASLPNLTVLLLSDNRLKNSSMFSAALCGAPIVDLDLDKNRLQTAPDLYCLRDTLASLHMAENQLGPMFNGDVNSLQNLRWLFLRSNGLRYLPNNLLCDIRLILLDLSFNNLGELPTLTCSAPSLEILNLRGNQICSIPNGAFTAMFPGLRYLNLDRNCLADIYWVSSLRGTLEQLQVRHNAITVIGTSFQNFTRPLTLELAYNDIHSIDEEAFLGSTLTKLNLKDNNITSLTLTNVTLDSTSRLQLIGNPLGCDCEMAWLRSLADKYPDVVEISTQPCRTPEHLRDMTVPQLTWQMMCPLTGLPTTMLSTETTTTNWDTSSPGDLTATVRVSLKLQGHVTTSATADSRPQDDVTMTITGPDQLVETTSSPASTESESANVPIDHPGSTATEQITPSTPLSAHATSTQLPSITTESTSLTSSQLSTTRQPPASALPSSLVPLIQTPTMTSSSMAALQSSSDESLPNTTMTSSSISSSPFSLSEVATMTSFSWLTWVTWTAWTTCSATCGDGLRFRWKLCETHHETCQRKLDILYYGEERGTCHRAVCPIATLWLPWQPWESCSATCGRGQQLRRRLCQQVDAHVTPGVHVGCTGKASMRQLCEDLARCPDPGRATVRRRRAALLTPETYTEADQRPSAQGVAGVALAFLLTAAGCVLAMDLTTVCRRVAREGGESRCRRLTHKIVPRRS